MLALTLIVVIVKLALVCPAATVTDAGTTAAELLLVSVTTLAAVAGALRVTVPVVEVPPTTVAGLTETVLKASAGGCTVNVVLRLTELYAAPIVAVALALTLTVVMVKLALVCPAATVTDAGTTAAELLLVNVTTLAAVAGALSVTVPEAEVPPTTVAGFTATALRAGGGGCTVKVVLRFTAL